MRTTALALLVSATAGCGSEDDPCVSETYWEEGGAPELMNPGRDCINCHRLSGGPEYDVAGTVYHEDDEPDDCYGVAGAMVRIVDDDGRAFEMTSNASGNFLHEASGSTIVFPITATVITSTGERPMATPQDDGSCNDCHRLGGDRGAWGRVTIP